MVINHLNSYFRYEQRNNFEKCLAFIGVTPVLENARYVTWVYWADQTVVHSGDGSFGFLQV